MHVIQYASQLTSVTSIVHPVLTQIKDHCSLRKDYYFGSVILFILISYEGKVPIPAVMKKFFFVKKKDIPHYGPSGHVFIMASPPNWAKTQNDSVEYVYHRKLTHRSYNRPSGSTREL